MTLKRKWADSIQIEEASSLGATGTRSTIQYHNRCDHYIPATTVQPTALLLLHHTREPTVRNAHSLKLEQINLATASELVQHKQARSFKATRWNGRNSSLNPKQIFNLTPQYHAALPSV